MNDAGSSQARESGPAAGSSTAEQQNPDQQEVASGTVHEAIEGWVPQLASDEDLRIALEKAFDYRGDVTVTLKDGSKIEGYIFDRVSGPGTLNQFREDFAEGFESTA